jgi:serine/threonine protein phosphatase PrpC
MADFRAFAVSGLLPICMAETDAELAAISEPVSPFSPPPTPGDIEKGENPAPDSEGSLQPSDPNALPETPGEQGAEGAEGQEGAAADTESDEQNEQPQDEAADAEDTSTEEAVPTEEVPQYTEETQVPEPPLTEPPEPEGLGFVPALLIGALAGCLVGAGICWIISRLRGKGRASKNGRNKLQVVTLQVVGARENQQDSLAATDPELYSEQGVLLCVADGMGGLRNGGMVSRTAVSTVMSKFAVLDKTDPERMIAALVQSATSAVNMVLSPDYGSGGTTLLIGFVKDGLFYYAAVGDSRICLYRDGKLIHLNRPHVFEDELLLRYINGEISYDSARNYEKRGALTSYLGMGKLKYADIPAYHIPIRSGDRFVLMSDGIFNTLSDEEIAGIIGGRSDNVPAMLNREIEKKHTRFQDNYSAVVLAVD